MNMPSHRNISNNSPAILKLIFWEHNNKWCTFVCLIAIILQFTIFKSLYPFAGFIHDDSFTYLDAASSNSAINLYPIGYSKFLRLFNVFSKSDKVLIGFQYFSLMISTLAWVLTITHLYRISITGKIILLSTIILNPIFLYLSNYVSSDALFLTFSFTWFTQLLWMIYRPSVKLFIWNAFVLLSAFTIRYSALFFPVILAIAYLLVNFPLWPKIAGFLLNILLLALFSVATSQQYQKLDGFFQFSPFAGWQIANNALYGYRFVDKNSLQSLPAKFNQLDKTVRNYFDSTIIGENFPEGAVKAHTYYMWAPNSPLRIYMRNSHIKEAKNNDLKYWSMMAPLYREYGSIIIKRYPDKFFEYYLLPNIINYCMPPVEFLGTYNMGRDTVRNIAQKWFNYKTNKVTNYFEDNNVHIFNYSPVFVAIVNSIFVLSLLSFLYLKGYQHSKLMGKSLCLIIGLWLLNLLFSVYVSPIALRFQLFPIIVTLTFSVVFVDYLCKEAFKTKAHYQH